MTKGLPAYAAQRDQNENEIVRIFRKLGASVYRMDKPVDLLIGYKGYNILVEVKRPKGPRGGDSHSRLNAKQQEFIDGWRGRVFVVRTPVEAEDLLLQVARL